MRFMRLRYSYSRASITRMNLDTLIRRMIREEIAALGLASSSCPPPHPAVDVVADLVGELPPGEEWTATELLARLVPSLAPSESPWTTHRLGRQLRAFVGRASNGRVLRHRRGRREGVSLYSVALAPTPRVTPPDSSFPASPPPLPSAGLVVALESWAALGGEGAGLTAAEAITAGQERPEPWRRLCEAVGAIARGSAGAVLAAHAGGGRAPVAKEVGDALRALPGRAAGGLRLAGTHNRNGSMRWRVERSPRP